jgi:hypothetical protein
MRFLPDQQYTSLIAHQKLSPDEVVCYLTVVPLNEDEDQQHKIAQAASA